jgi:lysyl endopeptidase
MHRLSITVIVCVVLVAGLSAAETPRSGGVSDFLPQKAVRLGTLRTPQTVDREAAKRELADLHARLTAERVAAGVERPLVVEMSTKELAEIGLGVCEGCAEEPQALRVGVTRQVYAELTLDSVRWGAVKRSPDGGRVWSAAVKSAGAFGLRLHFDNFELPEGSELYLFNEAGAVAGPYTKSGPLGTGEFWSHMVRGEVVYLQLRQLGRNQPDKVHRSLFRLVDIGHVATGFGVARAGAAAKEFCNHNADCVVNAECVSVHDAVTDVKYAVAHMMFVKRPFLYICSGGLLNNTAEDETPYFLTANHCISRDREAGTLEAYFQWWIDCGEECPAQWEPPELAPGTLGSSVVATNKTGDYTLLLLAGPAPDGSAFLGWNSEQEIAFTDDADLYRISHPSGAPQAYSEHVVDTSAPTCSSWPRGSWIYSRDIYGATEGGSSGSPVVNSDGEVVGQLSGSCGTNIGDDCDAVNNATVDGAFASYYSQVEQWLVPGSGGSCGASGDPCEDNEDCCSLSCHPRKNTCR